MFRVVLVALAHLAGGTSFPEAVAYRGLGDSGGYIQRLTEYCFTKGGESQFVGTDGSEMLKNDEFCYIYPNKMFESPEPCAYDSIAKCVKSSIETIFTANLNDGEFAGPVCASHDRCKLYFTFYDSGKDYADEGGCGITSVASQNLIRRLASSIS